jgi:peptidoglycan hydrolase-like protein with peptidoglycan-binding domain
MPPIDFLTSNKPSSTPSSIPTGPINAPKKALQQGDLHYDVARVQRALKAKGMYSGKIDGDFGPKTRAAVEKFQKTVSLPQDGVVGKETFRALIDSSQGNGVDFNPSLFSRNFSQLDSASNKERVQALQRDLYKNGFLSEHGNVRKTSDPSEQKWDGIIGDRTSKALMDAAKAAKLSPQAFLNTYGIKLVQVNLLHQAHQVSLKELLQ